MTGTREERRGHHEDGEEQQSSSLRAGEAAIHSHEVDSMTGGINDVADCFRATRGGSDDWQLLGWLSNESV